MAEQNYISGPHDGGLCACRHDGERWTAKCIAAATADKTNAARWAADFIRANPNIDFTPCYRELARPFLIPESRTNEDLR